MKTKRIISLLSICIISFFFIYSACETDKSNDPGSPVAPPIPPADPTVLNLNYYFSGASIGTEDPLILHIYDNKSDMTNQSNPLFAHTTTTYGHDHCSEYPGPGTYYVLIWHHGEDPEDTLQGCERYLIWTNFSWNPGQNVMATPIVVDAGTTVNANVYVDESDFKWWWPCE